MITRLAEYFARRSREKREKTIRKLCEKDFHLAKRTCFACAPSGWQAARIPFDAANFVRFVRFA